jgi:hypothetical protein
MRTVQGTILQSLRAVKSFLVEHADKLPGLQQTGASKRLDDAIAALDTHASNQTGSVIDSQSLTQRQRKLRVVLRRDHMAPIVRIARADLPNTPEFRPLRMPRGKITPEKLAAAASGMAQVAARYADTFTAAGLPADFVEQLNGAADNMLNALSDRTRSRGKRRGATAGLKEKLSEGRKVAAILDSFVQKTLPDNPSLLADWNLVVRVPKTATRSQTSDATLLPSADSTAAITAPARPALPAASQPASAESEPEPEPNVNVPVTTSIEPPLEAQPTAPVPSASSTSATKGDA